jgi:hypothetical protein
VLVRGFRVTALAIGLALTLALVAVVGLEEAAAATVPAGQVSPTQSNVSSNWAGYVATGTHSDGGAPATFSTVTATWVQPKADCGATTTTGPTASAFWVGLGGDANSSNALEQTGTEADCTSSGASYFAWYELVPAGSVKVKLAVAAGNKVSASVGVDAGKVTIHLQNLTRGTSFLKTLSMARPDTTSADWIAEAPSVCGDTGYHCDQQTLTDFGTVQFTGASAVSGGASGAISDPAWQESPVVMQAGAGHGFGFGFGGFGRFAPEQGVSEAQPSTLTSNGSAFSITWHQLSGAQPSGGYGGGYGGGFGGGGYPGGGYGGGGYGGGGYGGGGFGI